jgi:acetyl/propionyl-CoA carboxylase alpha subunit
VAMADAAVRIGPPPAAESYLDGARIIAAALDTGAEAIHPGYGFLSENPGFVEAVVAAGLTFIGPPASAIRAMGLKDAAKALMEKAGVPVVPGYHGDNQDDAFLADQAALIGYPVLIKAVAGGGGKGMRRVDHPREFATRWLLRAARRPRPSATTRCSSRNTSPRRAISRSRCSATTTATPCTCSSATARCSAATRR